MRYSYFKDLKPEYQEAVMAQEHARMLEARNNLINRCGQAVADDCWWSKMDYINSWKFADDYLFEICEDCGCPTQLMECISDVPADYQQRKVTFKCKCGKWHIAYE